MEMEIRAALCVHEAREGLNALRSLFIHNYIHNLIRISWHVCTNKIMQWKFDMLTKSVYFYHTDKNLLSKSFIFSSK